MTGVEQARIFWRKSTASVTGECVEVAIDRRVAVLVRDSKNPSGPIMSYPPRDWMIFLNTVNSGVIDLRLR